MAHSLLMHGVGRHQGPGIRYAVVFRLSAEGRDQLGDVVFTDPWAEWDAMREMRPGSTAGHGVGRVVRRFLTGR